MFKKLSPFFVLFFLFSLPISAHANISSVRRAEGYNSIQHVLEQQAGVDKLLLIKSPSADIKKYMKEMSEYSKKVNEQIKDWQKNDPFIVSKSNGFPPIESKSRKKIESGITKQLLLSGSENFEARFLVSQMQATDYLVHTIEALQEEEVNKARKEQLDHDKKVFEKLNDQAYELLHKKYKKSSKG